MLVSFSSISDQVRIRGKAYSRAATAQEAAPGLEVSGVFLRLQVKLQPVSNAHESGWAWVGHWDFQTCRMIIIQKPSRQNMYLRLVPFNQAIAIRA